MSWNPAIEPQWPTADQVDLIETLIVPRARDLGGFEVRRALPAPERQMVGPFIFFDHIGPAEFLTNQGIDVRPHPHIGLATVTYLYRGEIQHRDSLGVDQFIRPGAVNWMIAGKGVTHSERTGQETRSHPHALFGVQTWVALPDEHEETDPGFEHQPEEALPLIEGEGKTLRLILGSAYGERAPVKTFSETFYVDAALKPGALLPLPDDHEDRGVYVIDGSVEIAGETYESGRMMIFRPGDRITIKAGEGGAQVILLGGETLGGPRYIWWNFVASSKEKIEAAKEAWRAEGWRNGGDSRFVLPVGDDGEYIPLP
jgi:redox-sensitive bicupin YhaK (pirin superfamily)